MRKARSALNYIYGGQNSAGYPLGRKMVFVTNPFDTRFPMTTVSKARYHGSIAKQRAWERKIIVFRIQGIRGLDYPIPEAHNKTLQQVIMSTTSELHGKRIFVGANIAWGCNIDVAYREEDDEEASEFIEAMPLILEQEYGPRIWSWFTDKVSAKLQGCRWSPQTGLINAEDEEISKVMDAFIEMEDL